MKTNVVKGIKSLLLFAIIIPVVVAFIYGLAALSGIILLGVFIGIDAAIANGLFYGSCIIGTMLAAHTNGWWIVASISAIIAMMSGLWSMYIVAIILYTIAMRGIYREIYEYM